MKTTIFISTMLMAALSFAIISAANMTNNAMAKTETNPDGYTFSHPTNWKLKDRENRFTTVSGTLDGPKSAIMSIEYSKEGFFNVGTELIEKVIEKMYPDSGIFESGEDKYVIDNETAPYSIARVHTENIFGYKHDMVLLVVIGTLQDGSNVIVQYRADENDFDKYLSGAENIIQSIKSSGSVSSVSLDSGPICPKCGAAN